MSKENMDNKVKVIAKIIARIFMFRLNSRAQTLLPRLPDSEVVLIEALKPPQSVEKFARYPAAA